MLPSVAQKTSASRICGISELITFTFRLWPGISSPQLHTSPLPGWARGSVLKWWLTFPQAGFSPAGEYEFISALLRPPRLFFLPGSTGSQSGDQSTYLSSYTGSLIGMKERIVSVRAYWNVFQKKKSRKGGSLPSQGLTHSRCLSTRYATASSPAIAKTASKPGTPTFWSVPLLHGHLRALVV
jgi:hypothetical protein